MNKLKNICASALVLLLSLYALSSYGYCSETSAVDPTLISVSMTDWNKLKSNNAQQKVLLTQLSSELQTARKQLENSRTELTAVKASLTTSGQQTIALEKELTAQKQLSTQLANQLTELQASQQNAKDSLSQANQSLQNMTADLRAERVQRDKTEKRLRQQKTIWQIVALGLGISAAIK